MFEQSYQKLSEAEISQYTTSVNCTEVKEGDIIILQGFPCRITKITCSKMESKNGLKKVMFDGINLFTSEYQSEMFHLDSFVLSPNNVETQEYDLINVNDDGEIMVLLKNGEAKDDLKMDSKTDSYMFNGLKDAFDQEKEIRITVVSTMGKEIITSYTVFN